LGAAEEEVVGKVRPGLVTRRLILGVNTAGADARKWFRKNRIAEVNLLGMIKNIIRVFTYFSLPSFSHPSCYLYCDPS